MNHTATKTTITITTTNASAQPQAPIRKRIERDNRTGQPRTIEKVKGIRL
jgi:hypothetical protein